MDIAVRAAALGVVAAIVGLLIRKNNPEITVLLSLAASTAILTVALSLIGDVMEVAFLAREMSGLSPAVIRPVIKCVGIGIIAKIGADACRDAGSAGTASAVEFAGVVAALFTALPLMRTLLKMM
ncbi:MAG TPA: stage III sporulation protein AD, partial [Clostridiales bacterium]|nr:stage III sporulation protein AD [Clostridiales bacterium]